MKNLLLLTALAAVVLPAAVQAAPANVVVVDRERVYAECNACKAAQTQLQAQATALQTRQTMLSTPLKTEAQALQTAVDALKGAPPGPALKARVTAFQAQQNNANQELARMQQTLQGSQANVVRQIDAKLEGIYSSVMVAKGANLAVDVGSTLAHGVALDVTTDVLAALNAQLPSVSVTAPVAAPAGR